MSGNGFGSNSASDEFVDITERSEGHGGSPARQQSGDHLAVDGAGARQGKKKVNPLVDLIDTEKAYVDLLAAIIRKVAAAWSRANFPPPELDAVFRSVEVVYRANRSLLAVGHLVSLLLWLGLTRWCMIYRN